MNSRFLRLVVIALVIQMLMFTRKAQAFDAGPSLPLERYVVLSDGDLEHDDGYLESNGRFRVLVSEIYDSTEIDPSFDYTVISGRPICIEEEYDGYKSQRIIPHWVRSEDDFSINGLAYVIVALSGRDPNPTITITEQPESQSVLAGDFAFFSVGANPAGYISYQWLLNGKPLAGENAPFLTIPSVVAKQAGMYSVTMTTGGKKISSKKALLRIVLPVTISSNPKSQTVKAGRNAVFRVGAKGTGPFTYQWFFNRAPIPNATKSFYTVAKATESDAGDYSVVVNNGASQAGSSPAALTVE